MRHHLEYAAFRAAKSLIGLCSWKTSLAIGSALGNFFHCLDARHRRVVRDNLRESDLQLCESDIWRLSGECFAHFGALFFASLRLLSVSPEELRRLVKYEGLEYFDEAIAEGKGLIGLTGHFGNWELMALALSLEGRTLAVIGRELDNPLLEPYLSGLRSRFGNSVIPKAGAMRDTLKVLKSGKAVGFLLDQDARHVGLFTRFFGAWASTHSTAAILAMKYKLPVLPIFNRVHPDGSLTVCVRPPMGIMPSGDSAQDIWVLTQLMTWCIEREARQDPARWFWMHRRFKTRPSEGQRLPSAEWQRRAESLWVKYLDSLGCK